jgi:hypothetical protein
MALDRESFTVPMSRMFQTKYDPLVKVNDAASRVSAASLRVFTSVSNGAEAKITSGNVTDLSELCGKFEFEAFAKQAEAWRAVPDAEVLRAGRRREHERGRVGLEPDRDCVRQERKGDDFMSLNAKDGLQWLMSEDMKRKNEHLRAEAGGLRVWSKRTGSFVKGKEQ